MDTNTQKGENPEKESQKRLTFGKALNISIEFAFIIIVPLLIFVYLGKFLDARYGKHFFAIIGILLALAVSSIWFYRIIKKLAEEIKNI